MTVLGRCAAGRLSGWFGIVGSLEQASSQSRFKSIAVALSRLRKLWIPNRLKVLILVLVGAAALSSVTLYNGYPFFFTDTRQYYDNGQRTVATLADLACVIGACPSHPDSSTDDRRSSADDVERPQSGTISTGRSVYYGIPMYLSDKLASIWLVVAAQAVAASWLLYFACRCLLPRHKSMGFLCLIVVVTTLSSLPFFVGYLMPDVFAGLYILAMALLIAFGRRLRRVQMVLLSALLVASFLFHRSHFLSGAMLLGLIAAFLVVFDRDRLRSAAPSLVLTGAAVTIGIVGFAAFDFATSKITGLIAMPPPFLLARVIGDGPGAGYLQESCPEKKYAVCQFVHRMPIPVGDFLWSRDPNIGVWNVVSPEVRVQIANEQLKVVVLSFLRAPLEQMAMSMRNFGQQLIRFSVIEFTVSDGLERFVREAFAGPHAERFLSSQIANSGIDLKSLSILHYVSIGAAMLLLLARFRRLDADTKLVVAIVVSGVILNALVTGTLSTPDHRFQARVIWVLLALAVIVELGQRAWWAKRPV